jgi:hypothetical protein
MNTLSLNSARKVAVMQEDPASFGFQIYVMFNLCPFFPGGVFIYVVKEQMLLGLIKADSKCSFSYP